MNILNNKNYFIKKVWRLIADFAKCVSPVRHDQQNVGRFY